MYGAYGDARQSGTLAYYDTKTEEIYVRGDVMDAAHRVTVADELTHVFQDQNFDLLGARRARLGIRER